jgi:predicted RNA-binding protein YlqC (UPF0109 family)
MRPKTAKLRDLLQRIIAGFIDHPEQLEISISEVDAGVYWTIRGAADDQPKLVGRDGAHVDALGRFLYEAGRAVGEVHRLELLEPQPGDRRQRSEDHIAKNYDPEPARALLLEALIFALGFDRISVAVQRKSEFPPSYVFDVAVDDAEAFDRLATPRVLAGDSSSLADALGFLWRARARRDGVKFRIEIAP